jgi:hypothetical protein
VNPPAQPSGPSQDREAIARALAVSEQYFVERDRMNATLHLAPVRYSPVTELVQQAREACTRLEAAADA